MANTTERKVLLLDLSGYAPSASVATHRKWLIAFAILIAWQLAVAGIARACSFYRPSVTALMELQAADAVFIGHVQSIAPIPCHFEYSGQRCVEVDVLVKEAWKGISTTSVKVYTGHGGGDCGYSFGVGNDYLIFASRGSDRQLSTYIFDRTEPIGKATLDLIELRLGVHPFTLASLVGLIFILMLMSRGKQARSGKSSV